MDDINIIIHGLQRYIQILLLCLIKKENQKDALSLVIEWKTFINESLNYEGEYLKCKLKKLKKKNKKKRAQEITCIHQPVYYENTMIFNEIKVCIHSEIYL